jgi:erythromycin esterase-like protein
MSTTLKHSLTHSLACFRYYRKNHTGDDVGWSTRDQHMTATVLRIREHYHNATGRDPRIIVWAHNSHVGDTRATSCGARGEWNLGHMLRQVRTEMDSARSLMLSSTSISGLALNAV